MIKEMLLESLEKRVKEEDKKYQGKVRVSSLAICPLKAVYEMLGITPEINREKLPILTIGSRLHEMLQEFLPVEEAEKEFRRNYKGLEIIGHIDGIMIDSTGEKFIVEFKTIADKRYGKKTTVDYLPSYNHILQAHFYMRMAKIKKAVLVYLLKSSGEVVEFGIPYNEEVEKEMLKILDDILDLVKNPDKNPVDIYRKTKNDKKEKWKCEYCFYKHICSNMEKDYVFEEVNNV
jgi:CRISPR-associated protein Cas4